MNNPEGFLKTESGGKAENISRNITADVEAILSAEEFQPEFERRCLEIVRESEAVLADLSEKKEVSEDLSLAAASMAAGLIELRRELDQETSEESDSEWLQSSAKLHGLLCKLEIRLKENIPSLTMNVTPEQGVEAIQRAWSESLGTGAYARLAKTLGAKAKTRVEGMIRSALEYCSGILPRETTGRIIERATQFAGSAALGLTTLGIGLVAVGCRTNALSADNEQITVDDNSYENSGEPAGIEVKLYENRLEIIGPSGAIHMRGFEEWKGIETTDGENELFERLASVDLDRSFSKGISDPKAFKAQIEKDAREVARDVLNKNLDEVVSPEEFVTLVNLMVARRLSYNTLELEDSPEGKAEAKRLNSMPIDQIYFNGSGVCRHYSFLVEEISEMLIRENIVTNAKGIVIKHMGSDRINHAWNVILLNPADDSRRVIVGFTDVTQYDFNMENAGSGSHPELGLDAVSSGHYDNIRAFTDRFLQKVPFVAPDETSAAYSDKIDQVKEILEELLRQRIGGSEEISIAVALSDIYLGRGYNLARQAFDIDSITIHYTAEMLETYRQLPDDERKQELITKTEKVLEQAMRAQIENIQQAESLFEKSLEYSLRAGAAGVNTFSLSAAVILLSEIYYRQDRSDEAMELLSRTQEYLNADQIANIIKHFTDFSKGEFEVSVNGL